MGRLAFAWRATLCNAGLGVLVGAGTAAAFGVATLVGADVDERGGFALLFVYVGVLYGFGLGVLAGLVHAVAQAPFLLRRPPLSRGALRVHATCVSALNVYLFYLWVRFDPLPAVLAPFAVYVALTPLVAARGYDVARTEAALSAARRSGASSASRVSESTSDSSRATSE